MYEMGKKIAVDLYTAQMKWVAWYLPIVYIAYLVVVWFLNEPEIRSMSLLTFTFQTATIFMLVCGILSSIGFLPMYVKHGVTRKSYFQGAFVSSICLSMTIIGITAILTSILSFFNFQIFTEVVFSSLGLNSWLLTTISYIIVVMIYFLAGWLIGLGFLRAGSTGGFVSIVLALVLVTLNDLFWMFSTPKPLMRLLSWDIPVPHVSISFVASLVIATVTTTLLYKVVRETPIKTR